jgi:hypothetical protein
MAADVSGRLDWAVQHDLEQIRRESLLARQDAVDELTHEINDTLLAPPSVSEIAQGLDRLDGEALPTFAELEGLLAAPEATSLMMEQGLLAELLKAGVQGQDVLKTGLTFLKHRRYAEAAEWWSLHRSGLDAATSRMSLLLLVLETLTHLWSGNTHRAEAARAQVLSHPLYRALPRRTGRG